MLKVWGRNTSSNVQKVMWAIGELGLAHEHVDAGGRFGELDAPEFLALNPNGLVPVIVEVYCDLGVSGDRALSGSATTSGTSSRSGCASSAPSPPRTP